MHAGGRGGLGAGAGFGSGASMSRVVAIAGSALVFPVARLRAFVIELLETMTSDYHPERHYMRGPGPAWKAKHPEQA